MDSIDLWYLLIRCCWGRHLQALSQCRYFGADHFSHNHTFKTYMGADIKHDITLFDKPDIIIEISPISCIFEWPRYHSISGVDHQSDSWPYCADKFFLVVEFKVNALASAAVVGGLAVWGDYLEGHKNYHKVYAYHLIIKYYDRSNNGVKYMLWRFKFKDIFYYTYCIMLLLLIYSGKFLFDSFVFCIWFSNIMNLTLQAIIIINKILL